MSKQFLIKTTLLIAFLLSPTGYLFADSAWDTFCKDNQELCEAAEMACETLENENKDCDRVKQKFVNENRSKYSSNTSNRSNDD